jgi:Flp pilus assembly protein TadD
MSKPMLVTTPFVLLLLDYWPLGRVTTEGWRGTRRLVLEKIPFLALSGASSAVTYIVQQKAGAIKESVSFSARLGNAVVAYTRYLGKALWPQDLAVIYPHSGRWRAVTVLLAGGLLLLISFMVWEFGRKRRYLVIGWLWFLGTLVPVIGLVQVGVQAMADRYMYMPLIGILLMLVWGASDGIYALTPETGWSGSPTVSRAIAGVGVVSIIVICGVISNLQIQYWKDSGTLFGHALHVTKNNYLAEDKLGLYLAGHGRSADAIEHYLASLKINPAFGETHNNLGVELARKGQIPEAMLSFSNAVELNPKLASAFNNLGMALAISGRAAEALKPYQQALDLAPRDPQFHRNIAQCLAELGRLKEAVLHYREAANLRPDDPEARVELAKALGQVGRIAEAVDQCEQALRLNSAYDPAKQVLAALRSLESNAPQKNGP